MADASAELEDARGAITNGIRIVRSSASATRSIRIITWCS